MDRVIEEDEYPSRFPLEKITSHLSMSLKLLEEAQIQWMNEKESLLREIERLRMENRTLRMEARSNENIERNSLLSSRSSGGGVMNGCYYLMGQDSNRLVSVPTNQTHQVVERSCSRSKVASRTRGSVELQGLVDIGASPDPSRNSSSAPRSMQSGQISPITSSQRCRVRHIQLEDGSNDHEPFEEEEKEERTKRTIKYREVGKSIGKKEQRSCLQAFECTECSKFYKAINSTKSTSCQSVCKHVKQSLVQNSGRHRFKHPPMKSPPGYWDLDGI